MLSQISLLILSFPILLQSIPDTTLKSIPDSTQGSITEQSNPSTTLQSIPNTTLNSTSDTTLPSVLDTTSKPMSASTLQSIQQSNPTKTRACDILIGIDDNLYEENGQNLTSLEEIAQDHLDRVNKIYNQAVFVDKYSDIYFRLARIQVMFGSCDSFRYENCTQNRDKFLEVFDQYDFKDFCLAFMFTYRDFDAGISGLASIGTVCRERHNSGFITFLNYGMRRELNDTVVTLAHELAHSLGAKHDEDYTEEDCHRDYIMSAVLNHTVSEEFSNCTIRAIQSKLDEVLGSEHNCFKEPLNKDDIQRALCGNGIVEPGEQCDCGHDQYTCNDPCCYPAIIPQSERNQNSTGALPCARNLRTRCVTPGSLLYGVYLPFSFILTLCVLITVFLRHDWTRDKAMFRHVTRGNIVVLRKPIINTN